jgi:hypothetical protein
LTIGVISNSLIFQDPFDKFISELRDLKVSRTIIEEENKKNQKRKGKVKELKEKELPKKTNNKYDSFSHQKRRKI